MLTTVCILIRLLVVDFGVQQTPPLQSRSDWVSSMFPLKVAILMLAALSWLNLAQTVVVGGAKQLWSISPEFLNEEGKSRALFHGLKNFLMKKKKVSHSGVFFWRWLFNRSTVKLFRDLFVSNSECSFSITHQNLLMMSWNAGTKQVLFEVDWLTDVIGN